MCDSGDKYDLATLAHAATSVMTLALLSDYYLSKPERFWKSFCVVNVGLGGVLGSAEHKALGGEGSLVDRLIEEGLCEFV